LLRQKESNPRKGDPGLPPLRGSLKKSQTSGAAELALRAQTVLAYTSACLRFFEAVHRGKQINSKNGVGTKCPQMNFVFVFVFVFEVAFVFDFRFLSPLFRHRVAETGQGMSARTV
jgi:hypothetical protein